MSRHYIVTPKNPILRHCSESFFGALNNEINVTKTLNSVSFRDIWRIVRGAATSKPSEASSLFFLAVQSDYLLWFVWIRLLSTILRTKVNLCYLMHEPRLEKGRVSPFKSWVVLMHQVVLGYLADRVLLPSDRAVAQAKTVVAPHKIRQINLTFQSIPTAVLEQRFQQLQNQWAVCKTFAMLGTASSLDKNPQGFLEFAALFDQLYPQQAQFIRGGRDRNISVNYDETRVIRFPSYLSETTKQFLFGLTHFVVIPYTASTQSGVITEALSHGKLIIVNDIPAFNDWKQFSFIFAVNFADPAALSTCIHQIAAMDRTDYQNRCWAAVHYFQTHHSESYLRQAIADVLHNSLPSQLTSPSF
jgi:glycosyltransferase involved in cell wall biosynthesis